MSSYMTTYLKKVADATIQHMLSVQPYEPVVDVDFGVAARAYLANIGFILSNRPDLIEDHELKVKLGVAEPSTQQRVETAPEQSQATTGTINKVTLYPEFNMKELRALLVREILQKTFLSTQAAEDFAVYLLELDQFKCILNNVAYLGFQFHTHRHDHPQSPTEVVLRCALDYAPMNEILQKWWNNRIYVSARSTEKEKAGEENRNLPLQALSPFVPEDKLNPFEVPNKTERANDFSSFSFFKLVVTTPQSVPTERYSKEEAVSRLVEVVGIPSQTANIVAEELLRQFNQQELKKGFETTLGVQRLFWNWMRSKYSFELFKHLNSIGVHEVKVWINSLLIAEEECQLVINGGLRIQNLTFLDFVYLLIRPDIMDVPWLNLLTLSSQLNKFDVDALLDTWKQGVSVF